MKRQPFWQFDAYNPSGSGVETILSPSAYEFYEITRIAWYVAGGSLSTLEFSINGGIQRISYRASPTLGRTYNEGQNGSVIVPNNDRLRFRHTGASSLTLRITLLGWHYRG